MAVGENQGQDNTYDVDIVFCIDVTGSMRPVIEEAKNKMRNLPRDLSEAMQAAKKRMGQLRVKLIPFRDLGVDSDALVETDFFYFPEEIETFMNEVDKLEARGGGDVPENGLEAIVRAMRSDWCQTGWKRRHIIAVLTDAPAIPFEDTSKNHLPDGPASLAEMQEWWEAGVGSMQPDARRLVLFAPDTEIWNALGEWDLTEYFPSQAGEGCQEIDMKKIIDRLVRSINATADDSLQ